MEFTAKPGDHYHREIKDMQAAILRLGAMVERNISLALEALKQRHAELAKQVIEGDKDIDQFELEVEEECIRLIALHQPVAKDLRIITTGIMIVHELERMGDLGVNIAERTLELAAEPHLKPLIDIPAMADHAQEMLRRSLDAYLKEDVALALEVCESDDALDTLNSRVFSELITYMVADPRTIDRATRLILIARYLERLGDHATNIAEMVVFMVEGRNIRHAKKLGKIP
jgi:phosphate transport system protein